jgi:hypothetical protein
MALVVGLAMWGVTLVPSVTPDNACRDSSVAVTCSPTRDRAPTAPFSDSGTTLPPDIFYWIRHEPGK